MTRLGDLMIPVATMLWGEPKSRSPGEWRFGNGKTISPRKGVWSDFQNGGGDGKAIGGGVLELVRRELKVNTKGAFEWLRQQGFDVGEERPPAATNGNDHDEPRQAARERVTATYDYTDETGQLLYQVVRLEDGTVDEAGKPRKTFRQRQPAGKGQWEYNLKGVLPTLFRLPDIHEAIANDTVIFVVEGEKCVEALAEIGVPATCNSGGAGKWRPEFGDLLASADVVIMPDNDGVGQKHGQDIAESLAGKAKRVRKLDLPGLPPKGDVVDWLAKGGTAEKLYDLATSAPETGSVLLDPRPDQVSAAGTRSRERLPLVPPISSAERYPLDALGNLLGGAAVAIARKVQVPEAMAGQSVLAAAALAAQGYRDVTLPYGQNRPLSLFFLTIADSGDRKSTADHEALWPIRKREKVLREAHGQELAEWGVRHAAFMAQRRKIEADRDLDLSGREAELRELGPEPLPPLHPILTAPDPTVEGLAKAWSDAPAALGIFSAEGGSFFGGHGMSADNKLKTAAVLSQLWDGDGIRRMRAGDGVSILPGRRLSAHLMVQPEAVAGFMTDAVLQGQGLPARFLMAAPESIAGSRKFRAPDVEDQAAIAVYGARLLGLLERPAGLAEGKRNELDPQPLVMTAEAAKVWIEFADHVEGQVGLGGPLSAIMALAAKAAEQAARVAGVLTVIEDADRTEITEGVMTNAVALIDWYLAEALRLAELGRVPPGLIKACRLAEWASTRGPSFTLRDVMRLGPNPTRAKPDAEAAINVLLAHGWIEEASARPRTFKLLQEEQT